MGSKKQNWELYKEGLIEMARVCKPGTGRAVLLTQDKKCLGRVSLKSKFIKCFVNSSPDPTIIVEDRAKLLPRITRHATGEKTATIYVTFGSL